MSDLGSIAALKTYINRYIKLNFNQEITGPVANSVLTNIVDTLNAIMQDITPVEMASFSATLVEGDNEVSLSKTLSGSGYKVAYDCTNANGIVNFRTPTNKTTTGFRINVDAACTIEGIAIII
jgi:hypothetical protein